MGNPNSVQVFRTPLHQARPQHQAKWFCSWKDIWVYWLSRIFCVFVFWFFLYFFVTWCENKNDENSSRSLSEPLNIGTHCEALETNLQMVPLAFWFWQLGGKCFNFGIFLKTTPTFPTKDDKIFLGSQ
jgi:hypothetical protein